MSGHSCSGLTWAGAEAKAAPGLPTGQAGVTHRTSGSEERQEREGDFRDGDKSSEGTGLWHEEVRLRAATWPQDEVKPRHTEVRLRTVT